MSEPETLKAMAHLLHDDEHSVCHNLQHLLPAEQLPVRDIASNSLMALRHDWSTQPELIETHQ